MKLSKLKTSNFDLEQAIMAAWGTSEDIRLIWEQYYDGKEKMTEDDVANLLLGLQRLHDLRCQKLMDLFEQSIKEKR